MTVRFGFVSTFFLGVLLTANLGKGQPAPPSNDSADPQGQAADQYDPEDRNHGVARISLLNGDVSVRRGDSGDQVAASVNAPLLVQDCVATGPASRAEVQFDTANRVRFGNDTEVRFSNLTADRFEVQLAHGTLTWAVLGEGSSRAEVLTPSVAVRPIGPGDYRVSVMPDGTVQITPRSGSVEVSTPRGAERLSPGQTMLARGAIENPEFQTIAAIGRDEWDVFNERRDQELQQSQSYNYVSRDIAGAEDLDNYGQWNTDPSYGPVWTPRVAADWSPYRLGRWGYEDYYGWTWISSDPWGWAPYHYGSWFRGSYGWSWCPGSRYGHYYYRPALVAFFGFGGSGFGLGFGSGWGFGNVGWVPLAPFERYHPWYGRGFGAGYGGYRGFGRNTTIVNNTNITNIYRNARVQNGVMGVNSRDFANGRFGRFSSPNGNQLQQAGMVRGQMPFSPTANHFRFNDRQTSVQSRANFSQTRFAGNPGQRQTSTLGRNFTSQNTQHQTFGSFGRQQNSRSTDPSWQRFGSPTQSYGQSNNSFGRQQGSFSTRPPQSQNYQQNGIGSGWNRFGNPSSNRQSYSQAGQTSGFSNYRQSDSRQNYQSGASRSVQVAPPVVRDRGEQFGRYGSNQPSYRQPSYSQPSYSQPSYSRPSYSNRGFGQQSSPGYSRPSYQSSPGYQSGPRSESRSYQSRSESSHSFSQNSHSSSIGGSHGGGGSHESSSHGGRH